jgi:cysteinyl-tRNA synthetase
MSKSLGNFFTAHELLEDHPGEALRYALLGAHYRQPLDFTKETALAAKSALDRVYLALRGAAELEPQDSETLPGDILEALEDDLNLPQAFALCHERVAILNTGDERARRKAKGDLLAAGGVLGLFRQDPEAWLKGATKSGGGDAEIDALVEERIAARKAKDFARADAIRKELEQRGILLEDKPGSTDWRRK